MKTDTFNTDVKLRCIMTMPRKRKDRVLRFGKVALFVALSCAWFFAINGILDLFIGK